jgi:hypothetical protein
VIEQRRRAGSSYLVYAMGLLGWHKCPVEVSSTRTVFITTTSTESVRLSRARQNYSINT